MKDSHLIDGHNGKDGYMACWGPIVLEKGAIRNYQLCGINLRLSDERTVALHFSIHTILGHPNPKISIPFSLPFSKNSKFCTMESLHMMRTPNQSFYSKLLHLSGHTAKFPCRACKIEGIGYQIPFKDKKGQIWSNHTAPFGLIPLV